MTDNVAMTSAYPPPPPAQKPTFAERWQRLHLWQKIFIPIGAVVFLIAAISVAVEGDPEPTDQAKDETKSQAPQKQEDAEPSYELVGETDTGLGNEVTVSVAANENTDQVFAAALKEYDAFSVTIVCAGQEDVQKAGYILFGNQDDGVIDSNDRPC